MTATEAARAVDMAGLGTAAPRSGSVVEPPTEALRVEPPTEALRVEPPTEAPRFELARVAQITLVRGACAGGATYSPALVTLTPTAPKRAEPSRIITGTARAGCSHHLTRGGRWG
jgi:hypothetical protein